MMKIVAFTLILLSLSSSKMNKVSTVIIMTPEQHKIILNLQDIHQLLSDNSIKTYQVNQQNKKSIIFKEIKKIAKNINLTSQQFSSFLTSPKNVQKFAQQKSISFNKINMKQLQEIFNQKLNTTYIFHVNSHPRLLQQNAPAHSILFYAMNPLTLSGLLVSLFLLVMILIGVNCLYGIKTNDRFGKNNLWVGKQS